MSSFFSSSHKRSEIYEWREALGSDKEQTRKDAVKKVIAAMTVGKDVSMLFSDVVKCVQTDNIELKKLVYLYIMNYAKTQPDLAILAVNTFVNDSRHENPLIRGLAVRTMGCIRVNKIVEYLAEPLRRALQDKDPYVRKTAAVAVAKLFDLDSEMAIDQGFVEMLEKLLTDKNPMVVANAVATLAEVSANSPDIMVEFTKNTVRTLLAAVNDCTEWGQIFILDSLSNYTPKSEKEATMIAERISPRLQHVNSAVVLSAIKVIIKMLDYIENKDIKKPLVKKMTGPLVTLLNTEPEVQYVALRNIDLIIQKIPGLLARDVKVFFCKYNDPIYVKLEKLEIMIKLVNEKNIDMLLSEFKEYATEVDVEFVRKSVRAIGRCAIKLESSAQKCIDTLLSLIKTKVNYVVQEAIIVIRDIFRKYPNQYEGIIGDLCENLDTLDEPEAKASMIWIIGEYAEKIEGSDELLEVFLDTFHDETAEVQLQLLTAIVKLYLKRPEGTDGLIKKVLALSTEETDNPDLRDRAFMYWRLLSSNSQAAETVVLSEKPIISDDSTHLEKHLLKILLPQIGTLASVYHKPPEMFVPDYKKKSSVVSPSLSQPNDEDEQYEIEGDESPSQNGRNAPVVDNDLLGFGGSDNLSSVKQQEQQAPPSGGGLLDLDDLLGGSMNEPTPTQNNVVPQTSGRTYEYQTLLDVTQGKGMQVTGCLKRNNGQLMYNWVFENKSNQPISNILCKFNKNSFGIGLAAPFSITSISPGQTFNYELPLNFNSQISDNVRNLLQVALKCNLGVLYYNHVFDFTSLLLEGGRLNNNEFLNIWQGIPGDKETNKNISNLPSNNPDVIQQKLESHNIFYVAKHQNDPNTTNYYYSTSLSFKGNNVHIVVEIVLNSMNTNCELYTRCSDSSLNPLFEEAVERVLLSGGNNSNDNSFF